MDVSKLNTILQSLKDQLKNLMAVSADLIERNSQIDSGERVDHRNPPPPAQRFELLLEDFLSSCNTIELSLRTMQECLQQGRASLQNLPITFSNKVGENFDPNRTEPIESNSTVSYNQYVSAIRYQAETAKAIQTILEDFINQQNNQKLPQ